MIEYFTITWNKSPSSETLSSITTISIDDVKNTAKNTTLSPEIVTLKSDHKCKVVYFI